jgi:Flp pilus assembly protein TadG
MIAARGLQIMLFKRFFSDRRGSVLPVFGMALVMIVGTVAAAVDYSRASSARTELQAVLDAVALMLSKEAVGLSQAQIQQKANEYVASMYNRPEASGLTISPSFVTDGNTFKVTVAGSTSVETALARLFGIDRLTIGTQSVVNWEMRRLELALALDNTGSMSAQNKMDELKKAVKSLLATLKETAKTPDHIKVAIIPFDTVVNVGTANVDAPWLTLDPSVTKATWTGCVQDRDQPYDTQNTAPTSAATLFPGYKCIDGSKLVQMRGLTSDWTALNSTIDSMTPNGTTNVTIGLAWGMEALTPSSPLPGASPPRSDLDKVLVLLTDGNNTQNRWTSSASLIDARTSTACEQAKNAGIKVYTIRVIEGNLPLLQACASGPSNFFDVKDASQLNAVFTQIGRNLANIRISK